MKKNQKIATILSTTAIAGGIGLAVVAQQCGPDSNNNSGVSMVQTALQEISGAVTLPDNNTNGGLLISQILGILQGIDGNVTGISSLNIMNINTSVTNGPNNTVLVAQNSLTVNTAGGEFNTYTNTSILTISNIIVTDGTIESLTVSNSFGTQPTNSEFLRSTFYNLMTSINAGNGASNPNQQTIFGILLTYLDSIEPNGGITNITSISFNSNAENEIENIVVSDNASTITVAQSALSISTNGTGVNLFQNNIQDFVISGLIVNNNTISSTSASASGLGPVYENLQIISGSLQNLTTITGQPPAGTNLRYWYDLFLASLNTISNGSVTAITSIIIPNVAGFVTNVSETGATISSNSMTFEVEGGPYLTYQNNGPLVINGISTNLSNGLLEGTPAINEPMNNLIARPTNAEIILRDVNSLNGLTSNPGTGAQNVLWTALLAYIDTLTSSNVSAISEITIVNNVTPPVFTNTNANLIGIHQNSIFIRAQSDQGVIEFSNPINEVAVNMVVINSGEISSVGTISGLSNVQTAESALLSFANVIDSAVTTNPSVNALRQIIIDRAEETITDLQTVTSIFISGRPASITAPVGTNSIEIATGALTIVTTGTNTTNYQNLSGPFIIENIVLTNNNSLITSGSTTSSFEAAATESETIINTIRQLESLDGTNPPLGGGALVLYNGFISALTTANGGTQISTISDFTISSSAGITVDLIGVSATNTGAFITANDLSITATDENSVTTTFTNNNTTLIIPEILLNTTSIPNEISSVGPITGLFAPLTLTEISENTVRELNGLTEQPTDLNQLAVWNRIVIDIQRAVQVPRMIQGITGILIDDPTNNVSFDSASNIIRINSGAMIVNYDSNLSPGFFRNTSNYEITINDNGGVLQIVSATDSFDLILSSGAEVLESTYNQYTYSTAAELNGYEVGNLANFQQLLFVGFQESGVPSLTRFRGDAFTITNIAPSFTDTAVTFTPGSIVLEIGAFNGDEYQVTVVDTVTLSNFEVDSNGDIDATRTVVKTGNFVTALIT